jgi:hypothetical protein
MSKPRGELSIALVTQKLLTNLPSQSLNIAYLHPRSLVGYTFPVADDLLLGNGWANLTTLALTNLRCSPAAGFDAVACFLSAHPNIQVLHLDIGWGFRINGSSGRRLRLPDKTLPYLREIKANKEIVNAILECSCDTPRPLETIKGVMLGGSYTTDSMIDRDLAFFANLRRHQSGLKRIELAGWSEMEDIRRLVECVPGLTWLEVGKKCLGTNVIGSSNLKDKTAPAINIVEWALLLSALPELTTFHGVRFFYFVPDAVLSHRLEASASDRSRIKKNDEIASLLVWKCPKLRCIDYWDDTPGRVIVLLRNLGEGVGNGNGDDKKVGWEVRRVKI